MEDKNVTYHAHRETARTGWGLVAGIRGGQRTNTTMSRGRYLQVWLVPSSLRHWVPVALAAWPSLPALSGNEREGGQRKARGAPSVCHFRLAARRKACHFRHLSFRAAACVPVAFGFFLSVCVLCVCVCVFFCIMCGCCCFCMCLIWGFFSPGFCVVFVWVFFAVFCFVFFFLSCKGLLYKTGFFFFLAAVSFMFFFLVWLFFSLLFIIECSLLVCLFVCLFCVVSLCYNSGLFCLIVGFFLVIDCLLISFRGKFCVKR